MSNQNEYRFRSPGNMEPDVNIPENVLPMHTYWQTGPNADLPPGTDQPACKVSGPAQTSPAMVSPESPWVKVILGAVAGVIIKKLLEKE